MKAVSTRTGAQSFLDRSLLLIGLLGCNALVRVRALVLRDRNCSLLWSLPTSLHLELVNHLLEGHKVSWFKSFSVSWSAPTLPPLAISRQVVECFPFLEDCEREFVDEFALSLKTVTLPPAHQLLTAGCIDDRFFYVIEVWRLLLPVGGGCWWQALCVCVCAATICARPLARPLLSLHVM